MFKVQSSNYVRAERRGSTYLDSGVKHRNDKKSIIYALFICQGVGVVINIGDFGHIYLGIQLRCG